MKVILSWSGQRSKELALALHKWLPDVIQAVEPWMSESDIDIGLRWMTELDKSLNENDFGILCLTPECLGSLWIHYEAGALSKSLSKAHVCPYLLGLEPTDIEGPLVSFQASRANKQDTLKLLQTINHAIESTGGQPLIEARLNTAFEKFWPDLEASLGTVVSSQQEAEKPPRSEKEMLEEILRTVREQARAVSDIQKWSENMGDTAKGTVSIWPSEPLRSEKLAKFMSCPTEAYENVSANDLFNDVFMKKHTKYDSIESMLAAAKETSGQNLSFYDLINKPEWSKFISDNTEFSSWNEMQVSAIGERNLSKTTLTFSISS